MPTVSRTKKSLLNMFSSITYSIVVLGVRFIVRRMFLNAFGVDILGYNSTFSSILNMLNLAELGIGVAITYKLYEPVAQNDYAQMYSYITIFRKLYVKIGWIVMLMGLSIVPILPYLVKENYDKLLFLGTIFVLQMMSTVATYWFAYKRIIFTVYQDSYICNIVDMLFCVGFTTLQIIDIFFWKNYYFYLLLNIMQVLCSNIILAKGCDKRYFYLFEAGASNSKELKFRDLQHDIGNVVISKLGGYVLNSTDALVVSVTMGAVMTGYMTNYATVYTSFQTAVLAMLTSIQPSLGNKIYTDKNKRSVEDTILNITFLCQVIGCVFSVTAYFLIDTFISLWLSDSFVLDHITAALFSVNVYIFIVMYPISLLFGALGFYVYDKFVILFAAIINIILSVVFVFKFGILGVLIGTTTALLIYWVCRVYLVYAKYYSFLPLNYIIAVVRSIITTIASVIIAAMIDKYTAAFFSANVVSFIIKSSIYVIAILGINLLFFYGTKQFHYLRNLILNTISKVKKEV